MIQVWEIEIKAFLRQIQAWDYWEVLLRRGCRIVTIEFKRVYYTPFYLSSLVNSSSPSKVTLLANKNVAVDVQLYLQTPAT